MKPALSIFKHRGSSMVETLIALPVLLLIGLGVVQWAFIYQAKTTLNYATFMAARAGAVDHADEGTIKEALARSLVPLYSPDKTVEGLATAYAQAYGDVINIPVDINGKELDASKIFNRTELKILNPTQEAIDDFQVEGKKDVLPNFRLWQADTKLGDKSKVNIQDANLLKLQVVYQYKLKVPYVGRIIASLVHMATASDGWSVNAKSHSIYWRGFELADSQGHIPILASATVRMQSTAHRNDLMVSVKEADTSKNDFSKLNVAEPIESSGIPKPTLATSETPGDGHVLLFNSNPDEENGDSTDTDGDDTNTDDGSTVPGDNSNTDNNDNDNNDPDNDEESDDGNNLDGDNNGDENDPSDEEIKCESQWTDDKYQAKECTDRWYCKVAEFTDKVKAAANVVYDFFEGVVSGLGDQFKGLWELLKDPTVLYDIAKAFIDDPKGTIESIVKGLGEDVEKVLECGPKDVGRVIGQYASPAMALKVLNKVAKITKSKKLERYIDDIECGIASFAAGTSIWTDEGKVVIDDIQIGQSVYSRNKNDHKDHVQKVTKTFGRTAPSYYLLTTEFETIKVTKEHPLWLQGKGWTKVSEVAANDVIASFDGDVLILDNKKVETPLQVYNFSVANTPNYFVGESKIWAHNAKPPCKPPYKDKDGNTIATPAEGKVGNWDGQRGNSDFKPKEGTNLYEATGGKPVRFKDGYPIFEDFAPTINGEKAVVNIIQKPDRTTDFTAADNVFREAIGDPSWVRDTSKYTWHHHQDGKTMVLIERGIHDKTIGGIAHVGGVSNNPNL